MSAVPAPRLLVEELEPRIAPTSLTGVDVRRLGGRRLGLHPRGAGRVESGPPAASAWMC